MVEVKSLCAPFLLSGPDRRLTLVRWFNLPSHECGQGVRESGLHSIDPFLHLLTVPVVFRKPDTAGKPDGCIQEGPLEEKSQILVIGLPL